MAIIFKYGILPDKFSNDTKKPVIKLTLYGRNATPITVLALLDSGADVSVIPRGLGEYLNLEFGNKSTSKGIGGEIGIWSSFFDISISQNHEKYSFKRIPVQIAEDDSIPIIIGRAGFFKKFLISFDEKNQKVKLKRENDPRPR